jgi:hypothetical protein
MERWQSRLQQKPFVLSCPSAVAENQPANKHRMNQELSSFAARLRGMMESHQFFVGCQPLHEQFNSLALELFALQFVHNPAYGKICVARGATPGTVAHWTQIPAVPTNAFKELELTSLAPKDRTAVFHSSGTTEQKPSRHFHSNESLVLYESSVWRWFAAHFGPEGNFLFLSPEPASAPYSSLAHMFETIRQKTGSREKLFLGKIADGNWTVDFESAVKRLREMCDSNRPVNLLGTAFSFVHLIDHLSEEELLFKLPKGSKVMETGGYKNRSRVMPKSELHRLITQKLGVRNILCEYGMSELSSQAYDSAVSADSDLPGTRRHFQWPPWARVQIISPETGREVSYGENGLVRILDLANVFSVAAIQTEDLGIRRGDGFELIGRAPLAEPRGCSLMTGWTSYDPAN